MRIFFALCITLGLWQMPAAHAGDLGRDAADDPPVSVAVWISTAIREHAKLVLQASDHADRPFAIVDKQAAMMAVYRGNGTLAGVSTVLLGRTPGDSSVAGVGQRTQLGQLRPEDRTTPAGRFESQPGRNLTGEAIVWIDYGAALAIHRLRHGASRDARLQRMKSSNPRDKRVSAGCVVVPETFYDGVVHPLLGMTSGIVYVMPEAGGNQPLADADQV